MLHLSANGLQMMTCTMLAMEIDGTWGRLLVFTSGADLVKHGHVVVLILHAGSGFTLLAELSLLNATREWPDIFLVLAGVRFRSTNLLAVLTLRMYHMRGGALNFLALASMSITCERRLLLGHHVNLVTHTFILLLLDPVHTLHAEMRWLDVGVGALMNGLIAGDFGLH